MHTVYILYSAYLQRYYTGCTGLKLAERIRRHNSNHKGFTGKADYWAVVYSEEITDKDAALRREKQIKKRGAKRFIKDQKA